MDISGQDSEILDPELLKTIDLLVTVCGHADEHCPVVPVSCEKQHWPFDDPAKATGSEEEVMRAFRRVRDQIKVKITDFIGSA